VSLQVRSRRKQIKQNTPKLAQKAPNMTQTLKPYLAVLSARFRTLLQYRAAAFAGFGTQLFWGLIRIMIFEAFYRSTTQTQPMTYDEVVTYIWLSQAFLVLLPFSADPDVRSLVRSGNVVYELVRPTNLYFFWFSRSIAQRTAPGLFRALPMFITATLLFNMQLPPNIYATGAWVISMIIAVLIGAAITNLLNISMLWTISGEGISTLISASAWLLSGITLPLLFFPEWAQTFLNALPFRYVMDVPFRFYMGQIPPSELWHHLPIQLFWVASLMGLGHFILKRATHRLTVQGG
jgi:ABC-2 type transport system permease protein